jgi:hypothetical protein
METDPVSETVCSSYLELRTMATVQKPSDSVCYTTSPEPFRFYERSTMFMIGKEYRDMHLIT